MCLRGLAIAQQFCFLTEDDTYDGYESDLGITAIALYDYQAGKALTMACGHRCSSPG